MSAAKKLICENPACRKEFSRSLSALSFRNFCSQTCYGTQLALRNSATRKKFKYCNYCGIRVAGQHNYCSPKCWGLDHLISKQELVKKLQNLANKLGRAPTKRECNFHTSCIRRFSSWTNALIAANLTPHRSLNQKMYKRRRCFAKDGHICNSVSELIIDNWLYKNKIDHQKETAYPQGKFTVDWSLSKNTFVEYFGLANDSRRYDEEIKKKQKICEKFGLTLIEIYSTDLFPESKLNQIFILQTKA